LLNTAAMKKHKPSARKLDINTQTIRVLGAATVRSGIPEPVGMFPFSNAYPTQCLAGTGCGNLSGTCC
jgi:hypothetical protein